MARAITRSPTLAGEIVVRQPHVTIDLLRIHVTQPVRISVQQLRSEVASFGRAQEEHPLVEFGQYADDLSLAISKWMKSLCQN